MSKKGCTAEETNKFYVTTPIYYVTARPHLGSLYSTLLADVADRWHKLQGKKTFFLTGTDEHGQKIAQAAQKVGKEPKEFVDGFIDVYKHIWALYNLKYTYFVRTTDADHVAAVQQWIRDLQKKGDIYKSFYSGWYCTPCETYITEKDTEAATQSPHCPSCNRETNYVSEECYFFRLSAYQDKLLELYAQHPDFIIPSERTQEVVNFVQAGLKDLSISRTTISWGIPFPDDPKHVVYVWADALNNYITAIGYGKHGKEHDFAQWWPADVQVMGKDIVRFHGVYWPAFLMASGLKIPHHLLVHGWIKMGDQKMSKSLGNAVDPEELHKKYGSDTVRYYLMRQIAITQDSPFSIEDLEQRISSDLANDLGNLLNRMITLALKHNLYKVEPLQTWHESSLSLRESYWNMVEEYTESMNEYKYHMALPILWKFINQVNSYFHAQEPWKLAKTNPAQFHEVISAVSHSLRDIAILLWPVMPKKMEELLGHIGVEMAVAVNNNILAGVATDAWHHTFTLRMAPPLFTKPESKADETVQQPVTQKEPLMNDVITIDDLAKVHLHVGTIRECHTIPGSDKLYRLIVDLGDLGSRQILSGIRQSFPSSTDLIGKQSVFVVNLKPRSMMGFESHGMMILAQAENGLMKLVTVEQAVPNGVRLR